MNCQKTATTTGLPCSRRATEHGIHCTQHQRQRQTHQQRQQKEERAGASAGASAGAGATASTPGWDQQPTIALSTFKDTQYESAYKAEVSPDKLNSVKYDVVIFVDNSMKHIDEVCPKTDGPIACIRIPESSKVLPDSKALFEQAMRDFGSELKGNLYVNFIDQKMGASDAYDPLSGLQLEPHDQHIKKWVETTSGRRVAIFDWDRTITLFEGIASAKRRNIRFLLDTYITNGKQIAVQRFIEDGLIYLCGGHVRLNYLRQLMYKLYTRGIDIIILTNNDACVSAPYFSEYVMTFMNNIPIKTGNQTGYMYICSKKYGGHKGHALRHSLMHTHP